MGRFIILIVCLLSASALAQAPREEDVRAGRAAILAYFDAIEAGDAVALTALMWVDVDPRDETRDGLIGVIAARAQLERSAIAKYGEAGKRLGSGFAAIIRPEDRRAVGQASFEIEASPDVMHMVRPGEIHAMRLRRVGGRWMVIVERRDAMLEGETEARDTRRDRERDNPVTLRLDWLRKTALALETTRKAIDSGQLTDAKSAETDLDKRLTEVRVEVTRRMSELTSESRQAQFRRG